LEDILEKRKAVKLHKEEILTRNQEMRDRIEEYKKRIELIRWRRENYFPVYEKELLNNYLEYKGNIRVFIRSRPILPIDFKAYDGTKESFSKLEKATKIYNNKQIELEMQSDPSGKQAQSHMFFFDNVFGAD